MVTRFGRITGRIIEPGLSWKAPFVDRVIIYRTQEIVYITEEQQGEDDRKAGTYRVSIKAGLDRRTCLLYWKTLFEVLARNPRAAEAVVGMAALYVHYSRQSAFVIRTLDDRVAYVESYGEESYNQSMMGGQLIRVELERHNSNRQKTGSGGEITQPSAACRMT